MIFKGEVARGWEHVRDNLERNKKYLASCENCFFWQKERCVNPNVTDYDMKYDGDRQWCSYWEAYRGEPSKEPTLQVEETNDVPW